MKELYNKLVILAEAKEKAEGDVQDDISLYYSHAADLEETLGYLRESLQKAQEARTAFFDTVVCSKCDYTELPKETPTHCSNCGAEQLYLYTLENYIELQE